MKGPARFLVTLLAVSACGRSFPPIEGTTRIDIRSSHDSLASITDAAGVTRVVAFVNARRSGWGKPWAGVPIGELGVTLYRERKVQGSFIVGHDFFVTQRDGDFFSRSAEVTDVAAFRDLIQPYTPPTRNATVSPNER
jgi:hypothetical protein